ncbi:MAG: DUF3267 domain-containing protein [Clostridium sp.]|nr:DUF3267 domain-containing protein [Clostridium sp.]MCM1444077.1 DUF3267 domain-containing protein [Candidatus Amulumruptor caecigallinarius]
MPNIIFKGLTKENDPIFDEVNERPKNANILNIPKNNMVVSLIFAIPFMLLCFGLVYVKKKMMGDFPMVRTFIPVGIILGIVFCFIHELLHALPQPKDAKVYIGFIPSKFMFYMKCKEPLSKRRFILMELLPIILGIVPLVIFMISNNQILNSIMWTMAMIGLVSPSPDYLNVYCVLKQVPECAYIQDDANGMCWFKK